LEVGGWGIEFKSEGFGFRAKDLEFNVYCVRFKVKA
jgi:hypothetical protein